MKKLFLAAAIALGLGIGAGAAHAATYNHSSVEHNGPAYDADSGNES